MPLTYDTDRFDRRCKRGEGLRLRMYLDSKGYHTIGYGFNLDAQSITPEIAEQLYQLAKARAEAELLRHLPWVQTLDPVRQSVMLELAFNMGMGNETRGLLSFVNTLPHIQRREYDLACQGFRASKWYRDVGPRRADPLLRALLTGVDDAD